MDKEKETLIQTEYANSVFEQPWWLDIVAKDSWGECFVEEKEKIIARLPYVNIKGCISNPRLNQTLGIWMDDSLKKFERGNSQLYKQKEIIKQLLQQLPKHKKISITLDSSVEYILPFRWNGFRIEPTFSYRLSCLGGFDEIKKKFGKTVQKNVNAATKKVTIETNAKDIETFLTLLDMSFARQNRKMPINADLIRNAVQKAIECEQGRLMLAVDEQGKAHSGAFFLYDKKVCYYLLGGQDPEYKSDGSQNLLLYKGIEFATTVSEYFDFEGSMVEGIENFFRQFGGIQVINYHVAKQPFFNELLDILKPRIKKLIGYKI